MAAPHASHPPLCWDLFCRVIDNYGDVGVCWRLARTLAARGDTVRLVIDDPSALAWMAPGAVDGVTVWPWMAPPPSPGDAVIEAFGCDPPEPFVAQMLDAARQGRPPVWINLEYLSAEPYVERSHGLRSPQANGLDKWFFYPGFTGLTGGLLRGLQPGPPPNALADGPMAAGARRVSLFCYENPALPALIQALASAPCTLLLAPGAAQAQLAAQQAAGWRPPPTLQLVSQPWLTQDGYDAVLAGCDLNLVRGEDSVVRALWAGRPFLWQLYPQHDLAHRAKLEAFLALAPWPAEVAQAFRAWNGFAPPGSMAPALAPAVWSAWQATALAWRNRLAAGPDLATTLRAFVVRHGAPALRESP